LESRVYAAHIIDEPLSGGWIYCYRPILHRMITAALQKQSEKETIKDSIILDARGPSCVMHASREPTGHAGRNPARKPAPNSK
jgi:hypothetical protein